MYYPKNWAVRVLNQKYELVITIIQSQST